MEKNMCKRGCRRETQAISCLCKQKYRNNLAAKLDETNGQFLRGTSRCDMKTTIEK
jgi:hypothetical protein